MSSTVIYLRRSVVDEDNPGTVSYDEQLRKCRALAATHANDEPDVLVDWGKSGGADQEHRRPAYQELRQRITSGAVRWVVSYDLSRLSRSTKETLALVDLARDNGARVHVSDLGVLDPEDPVGKFTMTALSGANTLLRDMASKRAKEQAMTRRANGLPIGRPPYGQMPGEDSARVLAAFDAAGSYHAAARLLNAPPGLPTRSGGQWSGKQVHQVVTRHRPRDVTARPRIRSKGRYALTGLLVCHCGTPMRVIGTRWNVAVVCGRGIVDPTHPRPVQISEAKLLPLVQAEADRLRLPEAVEIERAADDAKITRLEMERERVIDMYADGTIPTKEGRDRRLAKIDRELADVGTRTVVMALPALDWSWPAEDVNRHLRLLWERVELGPDLLPTRFVSRLPAEYWT